MLIAESYPGSILPSILEEDTFGKGHRMPYLSMQGIAWLALPCPPAVVQPDCCLAALGKLPLTQPPPPSSPPLTPATSSASTAGGKPPRQTGEQWAL